jgi:hypothetical protein
MERNNVPLDDAIQRWKFSIALMRRMRDTCVAHVLRYEDLVAHPERELMQACAFLGIRYDRAMLTGTLSDKMRPEYRRDGFGDVRAIGVEAPWMRELRDELEALNYVTA